MNAVKVEAEAHVVPLVAPTELVGERDGLVDGLVRRRIAEAAKASAHGDRRETEVERIAVDESSGIAHVNAVSHGGVDGGIRKIVRTGGAGAVPTQSGTAVDAPIAHGIGTGKAIAVAYRLAAKYGHEVRPFAGCSRI